MTFINKEIASSTRVSEFNRILDDLVRRGRDANIFIDYQRKLPVGLVQLDLLGSSARIVLPSIRGPRIPDDELATTQFAYNEIPLPELVSFYRTAGKVASIIDHPIHAASNLSGWKEAPFRHAFGEFGLGYKDLPVKWQNLNSIKSIFSNSQEP